MEKYIMKTIILILLTLFAMNCTKETIVEPIKYNVLIVGGHKEHKIFECLEYSNNTINMRNEINEIMVLRIDDIESIGRYVVNEETYPASHLILMLKINNGQDIIYDQDKITVDVNILNDSLYQGHIWGTVYNGPDILNIEIHFKIELGI